MIYLRKGTIKGMKALFVVIMLSLSLIAGEKIRIQLNWEPQFEFAAFYMAKEFGFYDEAGLDVELRHIDPEHPVDILNEVERHRVDVALYYPSIIPLAAKSKKYVLLSYLFQNSPMIALSKQSPEQLDGSCLYLSKNEYGGTIDLMLQKMGVSCRKNRDFQAFIADPKGIVTWTRFQKEQKDFFVLDPQRFGFSMYDDILFSSKSYYKIHKTALRKFVLATLKGWRYALGNIDAAATIIHRKYARDLSVETLKKQGRNILAYSILSPQKVGLFNPQRVEKIFNIYKENGMLQEDVDIYSLIDPLFIDTVPLSFSQREIIARTPILYSETNWPPFSMIDKDHQVSGMIEDYIELVRRRTGLDMRFVYEKSWSDVLQKIKQGRLDMAMATGETQERRQYAVFSKPYGTYDFAIASKREHMYDDIEALEGKRVAVGKSYTAEAILRKYKQVKVISVKTTAEALSLLERDRVDAVVDIFPVISYEIVEGQYRDMVISGTLPEKFALKAMFRKDLTSIRDIFNIALDSISKEERQSIERRYSSKIVYVVNVQKERYFKIVIASLIVLLMIAVFLGIRFRMEIQRRIQAEKLLRKQATRDPLTQLYNRRFFNTFMETELTFAKRYGATILFGIFDIDNFKLYNDHYGHLEGDEVLRMIAKKIKEICKRRSDFLFRLGGEEFGIYTRLENEENIQGYIEHIVKEVEALHIEHVGNAPYGVVTISLGVVIARIAPNADVTLEEIYKKADDLMYEAKQQGKNRAVFETIDYK